MSIISRVFVEKSTFLKNFVKKFIGTEQGVEDIVQEAYLKARRAEQHTKIVEPIAFLVQIAKNLALDELNKKARQATGFIEEHLEDIPHHGTASLESEAEAQESIRIYCQAIEQLPKQCQKIFLLRKVHGLKHKEIAKKLVVSLSTVEKNLKQAGLFCDEYINNHHDTPVTSVNESQRLGVRNTQ
ncbi:MAG: RNA polymerase sigma factor [Colwellia sp.]